ncbi:MAG: ATP-binding protein [Candidatus Levyibacteriota bacterium]
MPYIIKDRIAFLSEASKILSSSLDYNVTLLTIAKMVVDQVGDFCIIDVFEEDRTMTRVVVKTADRKKQELANRMFYFPPDPQNKAAIYHAAYLRDPIVIKDVTKKWLQSVTRIDEEREVIRKLCLHSHIFAPLMSRGKVIGVITIASMNPHFSYGKKDMLLVRELANRAGTAVDKSRLYSQAQEAIQTRDEFLSIASHELKTPLTSILLSLQLALKKLQKATKEETDTHDIVKIVEKSIHQTRRMSHLIRDLLDISVMSTGRLTIEPEAVSLNILVQDVIGRFKIEAKNEGSTLTLKEQEADIQGVWDTIRIEQVVSNLLSNAIKYGRGKPILVTISKDNKFAYMKVKDRGFGISKKDQGEIFNAFKRAAMTKDIKGMGVGLYISRQIVEAHGGHLGVESVKGKGSEFSLTLPLK